MSSLLYYISEVTKKPFLLSLAGLTANLFETITRLSSLWKSLALKWYDLGFHYETLPYFEDPGKARGCSTNIIKIDSLNKWVNLFPSVALRRGYAKTIRNVLPFIKLILLLMLRPSKITFLALDLRYYFGYPLRVPLLPLTTLPPLTPLGGNP